MIISPHTTNRIIQEILQSIDIPIGKMKRLLCKGITAILHDSSDLVRDGSGRFNIIPNFLADKIIEQDSKEIDLLFDHDEKVRIGKVVKFWREKRQIGNINREVLMAEYEVTSQNFIKALQEISNNYNNNQVKESFCSPDGFISSSTKKGYNRIVTAFSALRKRFPGLSLGHKKDNTVKELSICVAGQRPATVTTEVIYEGNLEKVDNLEGEPSLEKIYQEIAARHILANTCKAEKLEKDLQLLNQSMDALRYGFDIVPTTTETVLETVQENEEEKPDMPITSDVAFKDNLVDEISKRVNKFSEEQAKKMRDIIRRRNKSDSEEEDNYRGGKRRRSDDEYEWTKRRNNYRDEDYFRQSQPRMYLPSTGSPTIFLAPQPVSQNGQIAYQHPGGNIYQQPHFFQSYPQQQPVYRPVYQPQNPPFVYQQSAPFPYQQPPVVYQQPAIYQPTSYPISRVPQQPVVYPNTPSLQQQQQQQKQPVQFPPPCLHVPPPPLPPPPAAPAAEPPPPPVEVEPVVTIEGASGAEETYSLAKRSQPMGIVGHLDQLIG